MWRMNFLRTIARHKVIQICGAFCAVSLMMAALSLHAQSADAIYKALPNGVEVESGGHLLRVTALSESLLRVRMGKEKSLPEDASWAVLPAARTASVAVQQEEHGFATTQLHVSVSADLRIRVTDAKGKLIAQDAAPVRWEGDRFRVFKTLPEDAHFFGLGDKPGPLDRLGHSYTMWNTDNFGWQESSDFLYKSIPFFIETGANNALGYFFDNTWRSYFDFGHELPDQFSFGSVAGPLDYYLIYGAEPKDVVKSYAQLTGTAPLAPLWALGYQQSRYSYESRARLLDVAHRLRKDHIPADVLYLDIDFQLKNRPFTVDPAAFPNFGAMVKSLAEDHFHLVVITDLHIANFPNQKYAPFDSGLAGDHFVKNPDGSVYTGTVWPGPAVFPEFTRAETRDWWGTLYKDFASLGIAGFWNDMNEPAVFRYPTKTMPDDVQHRIDEPGFAKRTASHLEIHNLYGMENSRATYEGLLKQNPNERPFVLTRATYAGGQRYAATWTGDNSSTWNHLRQTTPQLVNLGLSGFALVGADIGGFAGNPSPELLTRWLELGAFQPIDRDHAAKGTRDHEPWVDGPDAEVLRRRAIEARYRLLPYIYATAEENSRNGMPILRPLFLEFPHAAADGHPMDLDASGEFLLGHDLLIAPNPSPDEVAPYELHLPAGLWYDYWSGKEMKSSNSATAVDREKRDDLLAAPPQTLSAQADPIPVFVRGGAILPLASPSENVDAMQAKQLTIRVYANEVGGTCQGSLYMDDGHSFAYQHGEYERINFTCNMLANGSLEFVQEPVAGSYRMKDSRYKLEILGLSGTAKSFQWRGRTINLKAEGNLKSAELEFENSGSKILIQ